MIYFIQDTTRGCVKIGYTGSDAADSRLGGLQTGNASKLVVLFTMPGGRELEWELHKRFDQYHELGEWFRPHPDIFQFIIEQVQSPPAPPVTVTASTGHDGRLLDESGHPLPWITHPQFRTVGDWEGSIHHPFPGWPLRVYLAGKIQKNCWRHTVVKGLGDAVDRYCGHPEPSSGVMEWPTLSDAIDGVHAYTGPFFVSCGCKDWEHGAVSRRGGGCNHGDDTHGVGGMFEHYDDNNHGEPTIVDVPNLCHSAIERSDVVFAWVDSLDCYGTVFELGVAYRAGKQVWVAGPRRFRDMWFMYQTAHHCSFSHSEPIQALRHFLHQYKLAFDSWGKPRGS